MPSQINAVTKDPERKMKKKIRKAESKDDIAQVEKLQNELAIIQECKANDAKNKEKKEKKKEEKQKMDNLTDDEFMNQCQKDNKKLFKDREELEMKERENKKKSIEKQARRAEILQAKKVKEEQKRMNMIQHKLDYEKFKKEEGKLNKKLKEHGELVKVEQSEKLEKMYDQIMKEIKNKKLAIKACKKQIKQRSMMIEVAIQGYMELNGVPYEEAQAFIYNNIREQNDSKEEECKPMPLMIDGIAKL